MDFKEFIEHLRQVASTRGGKVIVIILLIVGALLAAIRYMLWSGTLDPLEGVWRIAHNFAVLLFFFMLASGIASIILFKPKAKEGELISTSPSSERVSRSVEKGWIRRLSLRVILIWTLLISLVVYVTGWIMLWQDIIYPEIHKLATTQFIFTSKSIIDIVMVFIIVSFWVVLPLVMYMEFSRTQYKRKDNKHMKIRRKQ